MTTPQKGTAKVTTENVSADAPPPKGRPDIIEKIPSNSFWENDLELNKAELQKAIESRDAQGEWIEKLSGRQVRMLCHLVGLEYGGSVQSLKECLKTKGFEITEYFIVDKFGKGKSEVAVVEVAKEILSPELLEIARIGPRSIPEGGGEEPEPEERFDKTALLFAIFEKKWRRLHEIFHFDMVHKKGFASMVIGGKKPDPTGESLEEFLTKTKANEILQGYQKKCTDGSTADVHGVRMRGDRIYVFIRRSEQPGFILDGHKPVHGRKAEWIILDFSPDGVHVNIASTSVGEPLEIANQFASAYFKRECRYVNEEKEVTAEAISRFITAVRQEESTTPLEEICVTNCPINGAPKIRLTKNVPADFRAALDQLETFGPFLGNLSDIDWIKVLYKKKRVGLHFDSEDTTPGKYTVRYTDHRLNFKERREFEQELRKKHGIPVLSTEKRKSS
jgi:hypothetical protein